MTHLAPEEQRTLAARLDQLRCDALQDLRRLAAPVDEETAWAGLREVHGFADDAELEREDQVVDVEIENARRRLREIERASERMAQGSYGTCSACGEEIAADRLLVQPTAVRCLACQAAAEAAP